MKINVYTMLKTLHFTLQNGKNLSSGMQLLANTAKSRAERKLYTNIHEDLKEGSSFSQSLRKHGVGTVDVVQFVSMAEKGISFKKALEKIIDYMETKENFERESSDKTTLPVIYFSIAAIIVIGVKFFAVPMQMERAMGYSKEIINLVGGHLMMAQLLTDILFIALVAIAGYFIVLMLALFSSQRLIQGGAKQLALILPMSSKIVMRFEKFLLFSMMGEMLQSGISYKKAVESVAELTTVGRIRKALRESLDSIRYEGKFILHEALYDEIERGLLQGVGTAVQTGAVMMEIGNRARTDALALATKFFRFITLLSVMLMAFAVFIEFYTVVLTQILIQKGLIDATRGAPF